ncbi:serine/threonine protein kinase [Actinomyces sp. B33]|uniref:serine/threonine-protein kinase n=1 Tax=Actinomyces sp. B33 TaxID=2942131 RepID=UPI0023427009|nr:serine/threonine-protein kinase [Actinomyces sp. B33]MDC4232228.1 serine/threonine protein kinase [Actinomyces sp. B33]
MEAGDEIGGYALVRRLGSGGAGTVWLAEDGAGQRVAFKAIHPALASSEAARARLVREARTVNSVASTAVAHVLDIEADASQPFIVSEYIDGPTLSSLIRSGPIGPVGVAALAHRLADTIGAVHAASIVHRDIKPSNIICSPDGPVLIDFGIAMTGDDDRLTGTGLVSGTAGYTSPELLRAQECDAAADWWAWCATLLSAATGRPPFGSGDVQGVIMRVLDGDPDTRGLPARTAAALAAGLDPDPRRRPSPALIGADLAADAGWPPSAFDDPGLDWARALAPGEATQVVPDAGAVTRALPARAWGAPMVPDATAADRTRPLPVVEDAPADPTQVLPAPAPQVPPPVSQWMPVDAPFSPAPAAPGAPPWAGDALADGETPGAPHPWEQAPPWEQPAPLYAPDRPRTAWVLGAFLMMPLAMLPLILGATGTASAVLALVVPALVGAVLEWRERRRVRRGGASPWDTAAALAMSPLLAVRVLAGLVVGAAVAAVVPYGLWAARTALLTGAVPWARPLDVLASPTPLIGVDPVLSAPSEAAVAWGLGWLFLVGVWAMPTSADLRAGVSRGARRFLGPLWSRILAATACFGVVVATWIIITGGML